MNFVHLVLKTKEVIVQNNKGVFALQKSKAHLSNKLKIPGLFLGEDAFPFWGCMKSICFPLWQVASYQTTRIGTWKLGPNAFSLSFRSFVIS